MTDSATDPRGDPDAARDDRPARTVDADDPDPLLSVRNLQRHYPVRSGLLRRVTGHVRAVDGVSFDVREGEALGLVGESGCGKSTTAATVLGLEDPTGGTVRFEGEDVADYGRAEWRSFRRRVQVVFQDPSTAFDPRMTVGESVGEPLAIHGMDDAHARRQIVEDLLERVGLTAADADRYPEAFSGGEKQRVALARALVLDPDLLVVDEPVSALDVSVQAEILSLLSDLRSQLGLAMLFISHDLSVVRELCDRVGVMYLGELVEVAPTERLFADPRHPYTEALLASIPRPDPAAADDRIELSGDVPDPADPPPGCRFHTRCPRVIAPGEFDLAPGTYRRLLDLRIAVREGEVDPGDFDDPAAVRAAHGLPADLSDPAAESALADAARALARGNLETAADRLSAFESVCERRDPAMRSLGPDRRAACHLRDPEVAGDGGRDADATAGGRTGD